MRFAILALGLTGCFVNEDNYFEQGASVYCEMLFNCYKGMFLADESDGGLGYDDVADCVDDQDDNIDDAEDSVSESDCDFDQEQADKCMAANRAYAGTCGPDELDDISDECEDVWDCS